MKMRIGLGYDFHLLKEGLPLIIGGCNIPSQKGAKGHSDADVLVHAIMDAILGAMGKKDIGNYFPDTEPVYKGISSLVLLKEITNIIEKEDFKIINIDSVVVLQSPKISSYIEKMKKNIAEILKIETEQIGIKATTTEKIGPIGQKEAIASYAVSLLEKL